VSSGSRRTLARKRSSVVESKTPARGRFRTSRRERSSTTTRGRYSKAPRQIP
jgi:hypothetical protein